MGRRGRGGQSRPPRRGPRHARLRRWPSPAATRQRWDQQHKAERVRTCSDRAIAARRPAQEAKQKPPRCVRHSPGPRRQAQRHQRPRVAVAATGRAAAPVTGRDLPSIRRAQPGGPSLAPGWHQGRRIRRQRQCGTRLVGRLRGLHRHPRSLRGTSLLRPAHEGHDAANRHGSAPRRTAETAPPERTGAPSRPWRPGAVTICKRRPHRPRPAANNGPVKRDTARRSPSATPALPPVRPRGSRQSPTRPLVARLTPFPTLPTSVENRS